MSSTAPFPIPSPSGGGCRPQGRQERENVAGPRRGNDRSRGGYAHITYRLQAVRFSLFRHPPRGGSADATFPRWGKEGGLRIHPGICWKPGAAARRVGDAAPYKVNADSPDGLLRYCTAARNAEDGVPYRVCEDSPFGYENPTAPAGASGRRPLQGRARSHLPSPSGGRWHPPIPREADDGRGRT